MKPAPVQRIKTRPQFQAVMAGTIVARTAHFVLHRAALDTALPVPPGATNTDTAAAAPVLFPVQAVWFGAMVPKRWAKRAVTRNAIKRQIYNLSSAMQSTFPAAAHVVRLRSTFDRQQYTSASSELLKAGVRAELQQLFVGQSPTPRLRGAGPARA